MASRPLNGFLPLKPPFHNFLQGDRIDRTATYVLFRRTGACPIYPIFSFKLALGGTKLLDPTKELTRDQPPRRLPAPAALQAADLRPRTPQPSRAPRAWRREVPLGRSWLIPVVAAKR